MQFNGSKKMNERKYYQQKLKDCENDEQRYKDYLRGHLLKSERKFFTAGLETVQQKQKFYKKRLYETCI